MSRTPDKNAIARKMFDEGDPDDLLIDTERSTKRVTIRDEASVSLIKRRSPAQFIPLSSIVKRSAAQIRLTVSKNRSVVPGISVRSGSFPEK